jgi:vacuolar protein sorting-associated protein 41
MSTGDEPELLFSKCNFKLDLNKLSQIKISSKIVAIGTSQGKLELKCYEYRTHIPYLPILTTAGNLMLLDFDGNLITCLDKLHDSQISNMTLQGEYIATGGLDGKVNILSCYPPYDKQVWSLKSPILGLNLEPDYGKKTSKQFVVGKEFDVSIFGKGWFTSSQIVLETGTDIFKALSWRLNFVVWATVKMLNVYDTITCRKIGSLELDLQSDMEFKICWTSDTEFLIGCNDSVKLIAIENRTPVDISSGLSAKYLEILHQFKTDFIVAGLAPFKTDRIIILGCTKDSETPKPPIVHILDWKGNSITNDVVDINGYENFKAVDYHLEYLAAEEHTDACYFIASANEVIVAKPRTVQDHVAWLLNHDKLEEAFAVVETSPVYGETERKEMFTEIGQSIIMKNVEAKDYQTAAEWCQKVLLEDLALWEKWVYVFGEANQAKMLSRAVPADQVKCLPPMLYEMILKELVDIKDFDNIHSLILKWPSSIYTPKAVISSLEKVSNDIPKDVPEKQKLYAILVDLNRLDKNWDRKIYYSLLLGVENQDLEIERHQSFSLFHDHALLLIEYAWNVILLTTTDPIAQIRKCVSSKMLSLMVSCLDYLSPAQAVKSLASTPKFLHIYLNALYLKDQFEGSQFHNLQVGLFAEYDSPQLSSFLKSASSISFPKAYEVCKSRDLVPEMMYLLGKMGDNRKALFLIIERLGDVERAIEFAKEQNDSSLWTEFLKYAMDKPSFIVGLLKLAGGYINPLLVVERIPLKLEIEGLKDAVIQIMTDCSVQV